MKHHKWVRSDLGWMVKHNSDAIKANYLAGTAYQICVAGKI
jgi:hypothetical protein